MKTRILLLLALGLSFASCQNDCGSQDANTQITLPNADFIAIPSCWEHLAIQGFDSYPDKIVNEQGDNINKI